MFKLIKIYFCFADLFVGCFVCEKLMLKLGPMKTVLNGFLHLPGNGYCFTQKSAQNSVLSLSVSVLDVYFQNISP